MNRFVLVCATIVLASMATNSVAETCSLRLSIGGVDVLGEWQGRCKDGKPYGEGKALLPNGTYEGSAKDGRAHGGGSLKLDDGARYDGDWSGGKPHGIGQAVDADGDRYTGRFVDGRPQGRGAGSSPEGGTHVGRWDEGNPVGPNEAAAPADALHSRGEATGTPGAASPRCKLTIEGESLDWSGPCVNGLASGEGRATAPDGSTYAGAAQNGKPHGFGTVETTEGYYQGFFRAGLPHGEGTFRGSDGRYYKAEFQDGFQATDEVAVEGVGKSPWDEQEKTIAKNPWDPEVEAQYSLTAAAPESDASGTDPNDDPYDSYRARLDGIGKGDGTVRFALPNDEYTAKLNELERREAERRATAIARESERKAAEIREGIEAESAAKRRAAFEAERARRRAALESAARKGAASLKRDLEAERARQAREEHKRALRARLEKNKRMATLRQTLNRELARCNTLGPTADRSMCPVAAWHTNTTKAQVKNCERQVRQLRAKQKAARNQCRNRARSSYRSRLARLLTRNP